MILDYIEERRRRQTIEEVTGAVLTGASIALIAYGVGVLTAPQSGKETREDLKIAAADLADKARDTANDVADELYVRGLEARDAASELKDKAVDRASDIAEDVSETADKVANKAADTASDVADKASDSANEVADKIKDKTKQVSEDTKDAVDDLGRKLDNKTDDVKDDFKDKSDAIKAKAEYEKNQKSNKAVDTAKSADELDYKVVKDHNVDKIDPKK